MPEAITTPQQALIRAFVLTRLQSIFSPPRATLVKVSDDVTPFLGEGNVGKPAWLVEYPAGSLMFPGPSTAQDSYRRVFTLYLEAASGHLFFVNSTYDGPPDPDMRPMLSCGEATAQLSSEEEVYDGYPDEDPRVDFLGALESLQHGGVGSPLRAKEIHGAYVLHSRLGSRPKPAWAITLRGLPPFAAHGPDPNRVPVWQRNHMRNVVDAMTGQVLFASNSPQ